MIMGVPNYFSYILKNHKHILVNINYYKYNNLYLDANSIIYDNLHKDGNIYKNVYDSIMVIIQKIKADKNYICFDGVAPLAKLQQQKQRRYKSYITKHILNTNHKFNSNSITPGTNFMNELNDYLKTHLDNNIILSGSNEPGEGEYKIYNLIRKNKENKNHIIYGLDADLIMLSLLQYPKEIYLYRETKHFSYLKFIQENEEYVLNISQLSIQINNLLCNDTKNIKRSIDNYCFLCFLCGNDFLPHFPSINIRNFGINHLIYKFKEVVKQDTLILDKDINWGMFRKFCLSLSKQEDELIIKQIDWKKTKNYPALTQEDKLNYLPQKDTEYEDYLKRFIHKYNEVLFYQEEDGEICHNYLEMIEWTWNYYNGKEVDMYTYYKYSYAPKFSSLFSTIGIEDDIYFLKKEVNTNYVNPITQLFYVLPYDDFELIPYESKEKILTVFPELKEKNFNIYYHFCLFFWESHVDFYELDIDKLNKLIIC